jgi:hypothetical protein
MGKSDSKPATAVLERMNTERAASYLGMRPTTLNNWRIAGKGPRFLRIGSRVMYRQQDLDAYLETRTVETADSRAAA